MRSAENSPKRISQLVAELPEVYQPVYGHPEFSERAARACDDRFGEVALCAGALRALLGRPLRVLDLGCAQGYFGFRLAEGGAEVHGVDLLAANIELCRALGAEHPDLRVTFEVGSAEEAIADLEPDRYDLILGLSVFHHIAHAKGQEEARSILERASQLGGALILEMARHDEPLYWGKSQPEDARSLLAQIGFVRELAQFPTHLSAIERPLYFASNRYWILGGTAGRFESWSDEPHALAGGVHQGSRRYFFGADTVIKQYRFDHALGEVNRAEFGREKWFAENAPSGFALPEPLLIVEGSTDAWVKMKRFRGRLLLDLLREGAALDRKAIVVAVLEQLTVLEGKGLYHADLRTWNVLIGEAQEAYVLDFGSISSNQRDCVWPGNPFLSFLIFVREVASGVVDDPRPLRTISISPFGLPQPFRTWAEGLWRKPMDAWTFAEMHELLLRTADAPDAATTLLPIEAWMKAAEEALQLEKEHAAYLERKFESRAKQATWRAERAVRAVEGIDARIRALEAGSAASEQEGRQAALAAAESAAMLKVSRLESELELAARTAREQEQQRKIAVLELQMQNLEERVGAQRREAELRRDLGVAKARAVLLEESESEARRGERAALTLRAESDTVGKRASALAAELGKQTQALAAKLDQATSLANTQRQEIASLRGEMDALGRSAEEQRWRAESLRFQVESMLASKSWRATAPLRRWGTGCRNLKASFVGAAKKALYGFLVRAPGVTSAAVRFVMRRPALRARIDRLVIRHPHLRDRLKSIAFAHDMRPPEPMRGEDRRLDRVDPGTAWSSDPAAGRDTTGRSGEEASARMRRFLRDLQASPQYPDKGRH